MCYILLPVLEESQLNGHFKNKQKKQIQSFRYFLMLTRLRKHKFNNKNNNNYSIIL